MEKEKLVKYLLLDLSTHISVFESKNFHNAVNTRLSSKTEAKKSEGIVIPSK